MILGQKCMWLYNAAFLDVNLVTSLSMLDGSTTNFLCLTSSARQQGILEKEIFAGTNFRELAFDRENRENFCLAKISRYTVYIQ